MVSIELFSTQLEDFCSYLKNINKHISIPSDKNIKTMYYKKVQAMTDEDFEKTIKWLYDNWSKSHFPSLYDFGIAMRSSTQTQFYSQTDWKAHPSNSLVLKRIATAMEFLDIIRKNVNTKLKSKTAGNDFILKMLKENKIYNFVTKTWHDHNSDEAEDKCINFREFYPQKHFS